MIEDNLFAEMFPNEKTAVVEPITVPKERPSWDQYFMEIAEMVSSRATCPRRSVGAVLVKDKRIIATGYNGSPPNHPHCIDEGCLMQDNHCVRVNHAEANALLQGARYGVAVEGATCYCTTIPCLPCAKMLIGAGITEVVYGSDYRPDELLSQFQIEMRSLG